MEHLNQTERFITFTEDKPIVKYLNDLLGWFENLYRNMTLRINNLLGINYSGTWDPGSIAAGSYEAKVVTVTGVRLGDFVSASFSLDVTDLMFDAQVTAADTVTVILFNPTAGAINLGSGTLYIRCVNR